MSYSLLWKIFVVIGCIALAYYVVHEKKGNKNALYGLSFLGGGMLITSFLTISSTFSVNGGWDTNWVFQYLVFNVYERHYTSKVLMISYFLIFYGVFWTLNYIRQRNDGNNK